MSGFGCVTLDPPWEERGGGQCKRGADRHYPLLSMREVVNVVLAAEPFQHVAKDAHAWMWTTDTFLLESAHVLDAIGFRYVRTFCWVKTGAVLDEADDIVPVVADDDVQQGLGQYARGSHELCLFGVRGRALVPPPGRRPKSVLFAPRTEHSTKPEACYGRWFERVSEGPFLEMFARSRRQNWSSWGLEVDDRLVRDMAASPRQASLFK